MIKTYRGHNNSLDLKDWSLKYLKSTYLELNDLIYGESTCYGTRDIMLYSMVTIELQARGIEPCTVISFA